MEPGTKLTTETRYEGGKIQTSFFGHPPINVEGTTGIEKKTEAWSPPHLFIAAVEGCFLMTLIAVAEKMRIGISSYSSQATGTISSLDGRHFEVSEIALRPKVNFKDDADKPRLQKLIEKAKEHCLVARSIKTEVKVDLGGQIQD